MATNFSSLRNSNKDQLSKLAQKIKEQNSNGNVDERFWKLTMDSKTKLGYARIRFLPAPVNEDLPWVRTMSHGFKHNTMWYFENCPTTVKLPCPVCVHNSKLWATGLASNQNTVRTRKRKLSFVSNILVIEDPANTDNNGKVFLYRYGAKIYDKIMELIEPKFPDQKPADPFNLWNGCDFRLKSQLSDGFINYDRSTFDAPSELFVDDDAKKEAVWASQYSLTAFVAPTEFKSYVDLDKRFMTVLNGNGNETVQDAMKEDDDEPSLVGPTPVDDVSDDPDMEKVRDFFKGIQAD